MLPFRKTPTHDEIIAAFDPWTLACAVGAANGTIGVSMGFEWWLTLAEPNFIDKVLNRVKATREEAVGALRTYVKANVAYNYETILRREETKRGLPSAPVLGPGESMVIKIPVE